MKEGGREPHARGSREGRMTQVLDYAEAHAWAFALLIEGTTLAGVGLIGVVAWAFAKAVWA